MKNSQAMKGRESLHENTDKRNVNILNPPRLLLAIKQARTHVTTTLNVIGGFKLQLWMWLVYLNCSITNRPLTTWQVN